MDEEPPPPSQQSSQSKRRESVTTPKTPVADKSWEEIIPEFERQKVEEMEEQRAHLQLYMGPRKKKPVNYADGDKNEKIGETNQQETVSGGKGKKGVRSKANKGGGKSRGFTDTEVRRYDMWHNFVETVLMFILS